VKLIILHCTRGITFLAHPVCGFLGPHDTSLSAKKGQGTFA